MFTKHYSQAELDQWHAACNGACAQVKDASQQATARALTPTGQGKHSAAQMDARAMSATHAFKPDDWASECLFDCYNG